MKTSKVQFVNYCHEDYQAVCDFLIAVNQKKEHINWNWARWEWMYAHPYTDRKQLSAIGLWKEKGTVVGAAIYDMYFGEVFCGALESHRELLPEIMEYAYRTMRDDNGLGIAVHGADTETQELLRRLGYDQVEQEERVLVRTLDSQMQYELPEGFQIREIQLPEDNLAYQTVIWKGFDHEGDEAELEKMLANEAPLPPHMQPELCLGIEEKSGELVAHCTCWYDERTDYAYVEPVCTVPAYRGKGLGRIVVMETLNRCRNLGAKEAYVLSDQVFYIKLGFQEHSRYPFYWKK